MRVIVIGAGLGGLTLAHGLRRSGIDVAVYERDGQRGRTQGVSLHCDDRGSAALRACLPPENVAMATATMGGPRRRTLLLGEVDGELAVVHGQRHGGTDSTRPGRQVHRPLLRAVLLAGLEDTVRFGAEFTRFSLLSNGTVQAWFADGTTDSADVLVGADGIGSTVRRQYLPLVRVIDTSRRMIMGASPLRVMAGSGLLNRIGDNPAKAEIRGTTMVLAVMRFTHAPVEARNQWLPMLHGSAVDDAEDYVMWALPVTRERLGTVETPTTAWHRARELAVDLHPTLRSVVDTAWPNFTVALRIGAIPSAPAWSAGPVTVIGDAIHVAPGFGGNLAMQDAHRLRDALVRADRGDQQLLAAIAGYEKVMRQDSFAGPAVSGSTHTTSAAARLHLDVRGDGKAELGP